MDSKEILAKFAEVIWMLKDEEQHRLFVSLVEYAEDGTMPEEQGKEKIIFNMMKKDMDYTQVDCPVMSFSEFISKLYWALKGMDDKDIGQAFRSFSRFHYEGKFDESISAPAKVLLNVMLSFSEYLMED